MSDSDGARYERERHYHDERYEAETRAEAGKYYAAVAGAHRRFEERLLSEPLPQIVLELGCGPESVAFELARRGVPVLGIDLSPVAVEQARRAAEVAQAESARFEVMNAEQLEVESSSVDLVLGSGVLHHLDLHRASPEVVRVLRRGGRALFIEPLGHNPIINLYRRMTPKMRTPDEHPLTRSDIALMRRQGAEVHTWFFGLTTLAATPLRRTKVFARVLRALEALDAVLFRLLPPLRWLAWTVVIELRRQGSPPRHLT